MEATSKPAFDPSKPYQAADKPAFDPSKPFEAAPAAPTESTASDYAKSIGSGIAMGTAHIFGAGGDVAGLAHRFAPQGLINAIKSVPGAQYAYNHLPTTQGIVNDANQNDRGYIPADYQPQSRATRFIKTGAEYAGPGLLMGGEFLPSLVANVLAPAIASEALGQATEGTAAEPYARFAGGLLGAGAMHGGMAAAKAGRLNKAAKAAIPTGENLVNTGSNQFNQAREMGVIAQPGFIDKTAADLREGLKGYDPTNPAVIAANRLGGLGKPNAPTLSPAQKLQQEMNWESAPATPPAAPVEMNEVELIRKQLSSLRKSADAPTRSAAKDAQEIITRNQAALTPENTFSGDASTYAQTMQNAIGNYGAGKRQGTIQGKFNLAELNANSPVGGFDMADKGQALQRTMKQLARPVYNTNVPIARKLGFNPEETQGITDIANGSRLTSFGDLAKEHLPKPFSVIGGIARYFGGMSLQRQANALDALVRSRSPLALDMAKNLDPAVVKRLPQRTRGILESLSAGNRGAAINTNSPVNSPGG